MIHTHSPEPMWEGERETEGEGGEGRGDEERRRKRKKEGKILGEASREDREIPRSSDPIHKGESLYTHTLTHPLDHSLPTYSPPTHPPTHLSVFKNKQPGVVLSPWRETHVVHLISILTHTKIEPWRRTEKLKPKVSSQVIKLTAPDAKRGGESKVRKVHLDRQGQEVYKLAYSPHLASPQLLSHTHTVHKNGRLE